MSDEEKKKKNLQLEQISASKLEYYFFQIVCIIEYLHQRNIYYGDMKPANVLVFRDQRLKVGDLGISIKLDDDDDWDTAKYLLKGVTKKFVTKEISKACDKEI